ncbi:unnamed protein product [Cuscuta epithymum]|uniref:F-box domain-containing protein n=1 Tax=Cuscuta epithymum TaxID=186058 RepID=A0AAV0E0S2_9ASTE|nr:unnamed protein product [Cuscuta epithymum]
MTQPATFPSSSRSIITKLQNPFSTLPLDIIRDILSRLEGRQLLIAQCVSKEWYSLLEDIKLSYTGQPRILILFCIYKHGGLKVRSISPDLRSERVSPFTGHLSLFKTVEQYDSYQKIAHYSWRVLCSCNGFVLLRFGEHIVLWNPHTSWSKKVLQFQSLLDDKYKVVGGLCYDPSTLDHKVVLLFSHERPEYGGQFVIVSSLKSKVWRGVPFPYNYRTSQAGVSFNNTLHWMVSDIKLANIRGLDHAFREYLTWSDFAAHNKIIYFDLVDDGFKILPPPKPLNPEEEDAVVGTGIIDGCFCMARRDKKRQVIQVSLMKEYGKQESWITAFAISLLPFGPHGDYHLKFLSQNGMLFILVKGNYYQKTFVYDVKEDKLEQMLLFRGVRDAFGISGICFYIESF